jgi:hypothetical protein
VRPKSIVYFEWIIFGAILFDILETYRTYTSNEALDSGLPVAAALTIMIFRNLLFGTLALLVSRRRSKIAMWVLIAWAVLGLYLFLVRWAQSLGGLLGWDIVLYIIGRTVAVALLFTPSARRWMNREDEKAGVRSLNDPRK